MAMKTIAIIGGGISGLATLHYLNERFAHTHKIVLYERQSSCGGNVHTLKEGDFLFEYGPNGFLDNQPETLQFIKELGVSVEVIEANAKAKKRYVQYKGRLVAFPLDPLSFSHFLPFTYIDSLRLLIEYFIPKGDNSNETIYNLVERRCGKAAAEYLFDPMITGIFAGDIKQLHAASAFPKLVEMENKYGSLLKAFIEQRKQGFQKPRMLSFKYGMETLIKVIVDRYKHQIHYQAIESINDIKADHIVMATPAYSASRLMYDRHPNLAKTLDEIHYAPIAVAGFGFAPDAFKRMPKGFGYLVPSNQHKDILGVLIESNVYAHRAPEGQWMVRVMMGGRHHPQVINDDHATIVSKALRELEKTYGLREHPTHQWVKVWPYAIPQYEMNFPRLRAKIQEELSHIPHLSLTGNYLQGISFNDSINHAKSIAYSIRL